MPRKKQIEIVPILPNGIQVANTYNEPSGIATTLSGVNIDSLLNKAVDSKAAVEVLKELRVLYKDLQAEKAQAAFDESMSAFQAECQPILKEKGVPDRNNNTAYKYAPIEAIEVQIRPLLRRHGFSHTFDTDTASAAGWVIAKCIVTHCLGHTRVSTAKFPLGTKTAIMSDTQQYAAALTFANRRSLQNAYGLIISGEDIDGGTGKMKPAGPSSLAPDDPKVRPQARELWQMLNELCGPTEKDWNSRNQWLRKNEVLTDVESAPNLTAERYVEVINKLKGMK